MIKNKSGRFSPGMTVIEVLVVIAIISIMTTISLFYVNSDNFKLNSEARNLRSTLAQARMQAVQTNQTKAVKLFTDRYEDSKGSTIDLDPDNITLSYSGGSDISESGVSINFKPTGTAANSHYHMTHNSETTISIKINSAGKVWLEKH